MYDILSLKYNLTLEYKKSKIVTFKKKKPAGLELVRKILSSYFNCLHALPHDHTGHDVNNDDFKRIYY